MIKHSVWTQLHTDEPGPIGTYNVADYLDRAEVTLPTTQELRYYVSSTISATHISYWDQAKGGTYLGWCDLGSAVNMLSGDTLSVSFNGVVVAQQGSVPLVGNPPYADAYSMGYWARYYAVSLPLPTDPTELEEYNAGYDDADADRMEQYTTQYAASFASQMQNLSQSMSQLTQAFKQATITNKNQTIVLPQGVTYQPIIDDVIGTEKYSG